MPGFITSSIIGGICPPKKESDFNRALAYLCYSILDVATFSWAYILILNNFDYSHITPWLLTALISILSAVIIGFVIGIVKQRRLIRHIAKLLRTPLSHPIPTAWDYIFSQCPGSWLIITLVNGQQLAGKYDANSFSSSELDERDLYMEELYKIDNEAWSKVDGNNGIYIAKNQISYIEFIKDGG